MMVLQMDNFLRPHGLSPFRIVIGWPSAGKPCLMIICCWWLLDTPLALVRQGFPDAGWSLCWQQDSCSFRGSVRHFQENMVWMRSLFRISATATAPTPTASTTTTAILHYTTLHHITSISCGWGDHCNHRKKHNSKHPSVHQWIRSANAIHTLQQLIYPIVSDLWNFRHCLVR